MLSILVLIIILVIVFLYCCFSLSGKISRQEEILNDKEKYDSLISSEGRK